MEFEGQPVNPQPMRVCDEGPCQFMLPPVLNCGTDDGSGYEVEIPLRAKTTKSGTPRERLSFYIPADLAVQWFREVTDEPQADYQLFQTVWMDRANRLENPHFVDHLFSYAFWQERLLRILHYTYKRGKVQSARIVADYEGDAAEFIGKHYPEAEAIGHQSNENAFETGAAYLVDLTLDYKYKGDKLVEKKTFSVLGSFGREWYRLFSGNPNATVDDFYAWCEQTDTYEPLRQAAETAGAIVQYTTYGLKDGKLTSKRTEDHQGRTNIEINEAAELRDRMFT